MSQVAANSCHSPYTAAQSNGQSAHASSSSSAATSSDKDSDYVTDEDMTDEDMTDEDMTDDDVADAEWEASDSAGAVDFEALMRNFVRRTALATNDMEGGEGVE